MKYFNILLFGLMLTLFTSVNHSVTAQQAIPEGTEKIIIDGQTFYLHKVRKGEGLYRISVSYGVSQKEIVEVNPSIAKGLKVGELIKVPVIKGRNSTEEQLKSGEFIYHTVETGQTAYYISKRYRVDLQDIYDNNVGSDQQLVVGTIIKIPQGDVKQVDYNINDDGYYIHKVEAKETLYRLAKRYHISMDDIIKCNKGLESGVLSVGSFIRIPSHKKNEKEVLVNQAEDNDFEDSSFFYHKIKAGETLYSISTQYNAKPHEVIEANKSVNVDDLPLGYLVRVPKQSITQSGGDDELDGAILRDHKIKRKEVLSDVVEKYGISADILEKVNASAGINLTLWEKGMIIKVPTQKWVEQYYANSQNAVSNTFEEGGVDVMPFEKLECDRYDYSTSKPSIKVAVLLPFNVEATKRINYSTKRVGGETINVSKGKRRLSMRSKVFVEFYQGVLLALHGLKREGVNVDLFVYDTSPDTSKVAKILMKPELKHADLIIGPAYSSNLKLVSEFSKQHDIPMVYPLSTLNLQMDNNPLLFQANPSDTLMFDIMAQRVIEDAKGKRLVVIRTDNAENTFEERLSNHLRNKMYWECFKNGEVPDFVEYKFKKDDLVSLERMLDLEKGNTIIIPSIEEAQVNRIVSTLKGAVVKTEAEVTLWGMPDWMKFNTLNPEDICRLNGRIFSYYAVDYNDVMSEDKISTYRRWFKTEPIAISPFFQTASKQSNMSRYSLWGHDVSYYFITALRDYGKDFPHCIQHHQPHTIQSKLNFLRVSNWGGFYNHGLYVLKFNPEFDFEIEEVK